ncbi:MAG: bifunctional folylpolyglutamate synthase/dihydrofolate synthase [Clostridia bacterium]|nr:bifunctional folylpolyglutamate synthase/dihydrofolate synthase [Clostridia bacterium]
MAAHRLFGQLIRAGSYLGLERIRALMTALGNPQDQLRFVHIAGTNGKGSVSAFTEGVLRCAGYRVGWYTSPALVRFNERMRINGEEIPDEDILSLLPEIARAAQDITGLGFEPPSEFEAVTALALLWFARQKCDIVVLEVGMGGRLDATNVIACPEVAVIAALGLDHIAELGGTLSAIAGEKAAIIKTGCECVSYAQEPEAAVVIETRCAAQQVPLTCVDLSALTLHEMTVDGQRFDYGDQKDLFITLLGEHQQKNAALAIETVRALRRRGFAISDDALREGLRRTVWPARLQVLSKEPLMLLDGAHNLHGVRALTAALRKLLPDQKFVFMCGILGDKDYRDMLAELSPLAAAIVVAQVPNPRAKNAADLAQTAKEYCADVRVGGEVPDAVAMAKQVRAEYGLPLCCCGSLYMAGAVLEVLK